MNSKLALAGLTMAFIMGTSACNHPRTEQEEPRMPEDRELTPHSGAASTTDTAHQDTMPTADTLNTRNPAQPNF